MLDLNMSSQDFPVKVTVAMAVYNAAQYMESAISNILEQTFTDFELLIIDDGSSDLSREIALRFSVSDSRIRCIFKENNDGLSTVRNMSIKEARGEYLLMVDADDLMEPDTIAKAVEVADRCVADIVVWDYDIFYDDNPSPKRHPGNLTLIDTENRNALINLPAFMPIRLIRTEYARSRKLCFPYGLTKQDIPVHWRMMTDPNIRIGWIGEKLFHYRQHKNATSTQKGRNLFSLAKVMDIVGMQLIEENLYNEYREVYLTKRLSLLHGMYDFIKPEFKDEAMLMVKERLDAEAMDFLARHRTLLSRRTRWFYGMLNGKMIDKILYKGLMLSRAVYRRYAR